MMDWTETDPHSLRETALLSSPPGEKGETSDTATQTIHEGTQGTDQEMPLPVYTGSLEREEVGTYGLDYGLDRERENPDLEGTFLLVDEYEAPVANATPPVASLVPVPAGTLELNPAVTADIWQRLSHLVRVPARFNGLWPFLIPVASLALLGSVAVWNFWQILLWSLMLTAAIKISTTNAMAENAKDALNMAPLDLRWVGPLAQALNSPHPRVRGVAAQLLTHLLPHLQTNAGHLLNSQQRMYLNQSLLRNRRGDADLNKAILAAWANVGDVEAVPYVERLTHRWVGTVGQQQVRIAALDCLPRLEHRLEQGYANPAAGEQATVQTAGDELSESAVAMRADVDAQLENLREERRRHSNPGMRLGFLIASWVFIVPYTALQSWLAFTQYGSWKLGLFWAFLTLLATQLHRFSLSTKQTEAARKLASTDNIRAVGPLAEALEWPDVTIQHTASAALTRLLPRLTATDGNLLNAKQRASLYRLLKMRYVHSHFPLIMAILKALQQVGDQTAVPIVERLAEAIVYTDRQRKVKQLAADTIPLLTSSARNQGASAQLLRASSAQNTSSDLLLRGAMANSEEAPQQLLRASATQENT